MSHFNRVKQSSPFRHSLISPKSFTNVFPADNPHHPIQTPSCSSRQTFSRRRRRLRHSAAHSCIHYSLILDTRLVSWRFTQRNRKKHIFPRAVNDFDSDETRAYASKTTQSSNHSAPQRQLRRRRIICNIRFWGGYFIGCRQVLSFVVVVALLWLSSQSTI